MRNFWMDLKMPILALAPMANVTDAAFRHMFAAYGPAGREGFPGASGKPDVFYTEFVSVEGLLSRGAERLMPDLWFGENEHPIVAQIFGTKPEQFARVAEMIAKLGFDGIDINMGCPDRAVEKQGAGAALIKTPKLAQEIIRAAREGAGGLPVSVKTRLGWSSTDEFDEWGAALLEEHPASLTVHLRTRKEMSKVPAHWDIAPKLVELRDRLSPIERGKSGEPGGTRVLGNGDVSSFADAREKAKKYCLDGVMIGRGAFGAPWFFTGREPELRERLERMVEHTELFEKTYKSDLSKKDGKIKNFDVMKKHYKAYAAGFDGAKELRIELMDAKNAAEVRAITERFAGGKL